MAARPIAQSALGAPPDTYLYRLARSPSSASASSACAVIGSDDALRLFDPSSLKVTQTVGGCHQGVTCLETSSIFSPAHTPSGYVTGGRDGCVRCWDERAQKAGVQLQEPRGAGISALACDGHYVAAGTESAKEGLGDVAVLVFDVRQPAAPVRQYTESHTDTITQLAFQPPQQPATVLLSGSTDGLVSVFDTTQAEEEDALVQVLNPRSAVHCAGFLDAATVYVLSTDEQFSIYGIDRAGSTSEDEALPIHQAGDVREKLQCMYVIDLLQGVNAGNVGPVLAYGHNERQTLCLSRLNMKTFEIGETVDLPGAHGEEVVRDVSLLGDVALSCGEDGHVRSWWLGSSDGPSGARMDVDNASSPKPSKKQSRKERKAERFVPY